MERLKITRYLNSLVFSTTVLACRVLTLFSSSVLKQLVIYHFSPKSSDYWYLGGFGKKLNKKHCKQNKIKPGFWYLKNRGFFI